VAYRQRRAFASSEAVLSSYAALNGEFSRVLFILTGDVGLMSGWGIRVDIVTSALSSAVYNTGHCHSERIRRLGF
jgi:hypothetical protein